MDNESEMIRHQMEETRSALQEKLETLENQVKETVQSATEAVTDTVSTVREAVQDTVGTVKESVHETVETVKDTFDLRQQVRRHPWTMFAGATVVGFIGGRLLRRALEPSAPPLFYSRRPAYEPSYEPPTPPASSFRNGYESTRPTASSFGTPPAPPETAAPPSPRSSRGWLDTIKDEYHDELNKVKGLAISALGSVVRDTLTASAPPALAEQIKEVVDGVTTKLGGHPLRGSILGTGASTFEAPGGYANGHHEREMGRPLEAAERENEADLGHFDRG